MLMFLLHIHLQRKVRNITSAERPYESTDATIAATVNCYDPVTRQLILVINNVDIASQSVTFTK